MHIIKEYNHTHHGAVKVLFPHKQLAQQLHPIVQGGVTSLLVLHGFQSSLQDQSGIHLPPCDT